MRLLRIPLFSLALVLAVLGAACGEDPEPAPTTAAPTTAAPTTMAPTTEPAVEEPSVFRVAYLAPGPIDDPWYTSMLDSLSRLADESPYGLDISHEWFENRDGKDR